MSHSKETLNYQLPIFQASDQPTWQGDINSAMMKIDEAIYQASMSGGGGSGNIKVVQSTGDSTTDVMSQNAVTEQLNKITPPNIVQVTGNSRTDVMSQRGTTNALNLKQNLLIGTGVNQNIKTVGGETILGQGDIPLPTPESVDIAQSTGTSTTSVMSQKATTDSLNTEVTNRTAAINTAVTNLEDQILQDLTNYYTKQQTNQLISTIPKFSISVVDTLPTTNISSTTIYLVPSGDASPNLYTEYIYVDNKWEKLGSQTVDLTNYYTKTEADQTFATKQSISKLNYLPSYLQQTTSFDNNSTTVKIEFENTNLENGTTTTSSLDIPTVTQIKAGILTATDYQNFLRKGQSVLNSNTSLEKNLTSSYQIITTTTSLRSIQSGLIQYQGTFTASEDCIVTMCVGTTSTQVATTEYNFFIPANTQISLTGCIMCATLSSSNGTVWCKCNKNNVATGKSFNINILQLK